MSENKAEIPHEDRRKVSNLAHRIPDAKGYGSKQENYDVVIGGAERKDPGFGTPHFNVRKPDLKGGAEQ